MRKGEWIKVLVNYPRNPKLNGVWEGRVKEVGCYSSGFAFFKLEGIPYAFPNSSRYRQIIERRR